MINLLVPPLRERPEDLMPLALEFLAYFSQVNHKTILGFTEEAEEALVGHNWPGNIRELCNTIERAVILGTGERIGKVDLPRHIIPVPSDPKIGEMLPLSTIEELHIRRVIASTSSLQEAADILGMDQATLWRRRKTYGI